MQDAIALLPAARPPPVLHSVPTAPAATPQESSDATAGTPEPTHGYNLRARASRGAPSALSAAANAADEAPAYAPVSVKQAVGRPDWCDQPPKTRGEAVSRPDAYLWQAALDDEFKSLVENNTWDVVTLPPGARKMKGKWVYDYKRDADGTVVRYKARFVSCGYSQRAGVD